MTLVALTTLGAAAAACGDDDDSGVGTDPAAGTAATDVTTVTDVTDDTDDTDVTIVTADTADTAGATDTATAAPATAPAASPAPPATAAATAAPATTPPAAPAPDPTVAFVEVATVNRPVDLAWRAGDAGLYVVQQDGQIVRIEGSDSRVVLDLTDLTSAQGERGLLGLAFAPAGDVAYVNYTDNNGDTVVAEHPVAADGTFGDGDDARTVLLIDQPYGNHNGGGVRFGPDDMLYIGMGDGGSGGDPERRATDMGSLLGKLLRIDPRPTGGQPYTVPADNPFVGQDGVAPEIWASGLRNPWRFSFDAATGDLWIADVGQSAVEEINAAPAAGGVDAGRGLSFGWSAFEGDQRYNDDVDPDGHTAPLATYGHDQGCAISGGVRVRGDAVPALAGWYVYADYCSGAVWALEVLGDGAEPAAGRTVPLGAVTAPTAVVEGPGGATYVLSRDGAVVRLDQA